MYMDVYCSTVTIGKIWSQPQCPSMTDWIRKMWYIYTSEYHAAIKKNKTLSFAGPGMEQTGRYPAPQDGHPGTAGCHPTGKRHD